MAAPQHASLEAFFPAGVTLIPATGAPGQDLSNSARIIQLFIEEINKSFSQQRQELAGYRDLDLVEYFPNYKYLKSNRYLKIDEPVFGHALNVLVVRHDLIPLPLDSIKGPALEQQLFLSGALFRYFYGLLLDISMKLFYERIKPGVSIEKIFSFFVEAPQTVRDKSTNLYNALALGLALTRYNSFYEEHWEFLSPSEKNRREQRYLEKVKAGDSIQEPSHQKGIGGMQAPRRTSEFVQRTDKGISWASTLQLFPRESPAKIVANILLRKQAFDKLRKVVEGEILEQGLELDFGRLEIEHILASLERIKTNNNIFAPGDDDSIRHAKERAFAALHETMQKALAEL